MKILVIENNLLWSSKLKTGLLGLGHEPILSTGWPNEDVQAKIAIINLSQADPSPFELTKSLQGRQIKVIAHAGHKEKELHALGRLAGVDVLATNGELSAKLQEVLERVAL